MAQVCFLILGFFCLLRITCTKLCHIKVKCCKSSDPLIKIGSVRYPHLPPDQMLCFYRITSQSPFLPSHLCKKRHMLCLNALFKIKHFSQGSLIINTELKVT